MIEALGRPQTLHLRMTVSPVSHVVSLNGITNSGGTVKKEIVAIKDEKFTVMLVTL